MNTNHKLLTGVLLILIGMVAGMVVMVFYAGISIPYETRIQLTQVKQADPSEVVIPAITGGLVPDLKSVSRSVTPTVVYIETRVPTAREVGSSDPSMLDRILPRRETTSIGSGVLITADGYIITNNHVIADAIENSIMVGLTNKRTYPAKLVGRDPSTDLAVLKIESTELPHITIGDSDELEVGDWVMAVGNPFRLRSTVTAGIVSALGRDVAIINDRMRIESFIQTDAAINKGNSGGALVNSRGHLIGINTAIATENGAYQGYGFAVPINLAFKIVQDLIEFGDVQRAYLGVQIVAVDQDRAEIAGMTDVQGVEVVNLVRGGAADKGGLRMRDIVLSVNGIEVNEANELQTRIAVLRPGENVELSIWREGRVMKLEFELSGLENESLRRWAGQ
jgi:Do/DeqQ family serine protease